MGKKCGSECVSTGKAEGKSGSAKEIMIAQEGNNKFPKGKHHPRCDECLKEFITNFPGKESVLPKDWRIGIRLLRTELKRR